MNTCHKCGQTTGTYRYRIRLTSSGYTVVTRQHHFLKPGQRTHTVL